MASFFNLILDTLAPSGLTLKLNEGATYATSNTVMASIAVEDATTTGYQMKIWGTKAAETEEKASWETFAASKSLVLANGDGLKTVHIKVRDDVGNESAQLRHRSRSTRLFLWSRSPVRTRPRSRRSLALIPAHSPSYLTLTLRNMWSRLCRTPAA